MRRLTLYLIMLLALPPASLFADAGSEAIRWVDFEQGLAQSRQSGRAAMIYFYSQNCPSCAEMTKKTWKDDRVIEALNTHYTPIRVDVDQEKEVAALYKVYYLPTTWFVKPDGQPFGNRIGFIPPDLLLKIFTYLSK